jgi:hypothetical protein
MHYTLRRIIEDNEKNLDLQFDTTRVKQESDYLESQLPKSVSLKIRVRIATSLLQVAKDYAYENKSLAIKVK